MAQQMEWIYSLLNATSALPTGLTTWNGSDPTKRFDVYRNNVIASLIDALADSYPVVQALVGGDFFRAMSAEFIRYHPPQSSVLVSYGADFPDFISHFSPVADLPYLADVARLEWLRVESWHAADAKPLTQQTLISLVLNESVLARTCFTLSPAIRVLHSEYPVVSIWSIHQSINPSQGMMLIDLACSQSALLVRSELAVEIIPIGHNTATFIKRLACGIAFVDAVTETDLSELPEMLSFLIRNNAFVAVSEVENFDAPST